MSIGVFESRNYRNDCKTEFCLVLLFQYFFPFYALVPCMTDTQGTLITWQLTTVNSMNVTWSSARSLLRQYRRIGNKIYLASIILAMNHMSLHFVSSSLVLQEMFTIGRQGPYCCGCHTVTCAIASPPLHPKLENVRHGGRQRDQLECKGHPAF